MNLNLFGESDEPRTDVQIIRDFIRWVRTVGRGSFNRFRKLHGIESVPNKIGATIRPACERAGLVPDGTEAAQVSASHGRLCLMWRVAK